MNVQAIDGGFASEVEQSKQAVCLGFAGSARRLAPRAPGALLTIVLAIAAFLPVAPPAVAEAARR